MMKILINDLRKESKKSKHPGILLTAADAIERLSTTGKWMQDYENGFGVSICSACGGKVYIPEVDYDYCPRCGAKIEK